MSFIPRKRANGIGRGGVTLLLAAYLLCQAVQAQDKPPPSRPPAPPSPQQPNPPLPADVRGRRAGGSLGLAPGVRLQASIYRVEVEASQLTAIDAATLAAVTGTDADFLKALSGFGTCTVLYRIDQAIPVDYPASIEFESDVPFTSQVRTKEGEIVPVNHREGCSARVRAHLRSAEEPGTGDLVGVAIDLRALQPFAAGGGAESPPFLTTTKVQQTYSGSVKPGQPLVLLSADATPTLGSGKALAFISRLRFTRID